MGESGGVGETAIQTGVVRIRVENLAKRYPSGAGVLTVFEGLSLDLRAGESAALVGASGAGKSTLLHLVGGLDAPSEGEIYFEGRAFSGWSDAEQAAYRNHAVGYVWQSYHLLPEFTALENVQMPLLIAGEDRRKTEPEARRWLERMGLGERETHQAGELSGGEQQRVAIARALIRNPKVLLADEPTGNLDAGTGESIIEQLLDLPRKDGLTLLMATHNRAFAERCDRVFRIEAGRIEEI